MINKSYKIINNKFSRFFKFIFFLRYLLAVFFVAIVLFLNIPKSFDYKKKEENIKNYLLKNYGLQIRELEDIQFDSFPVPSLRLSNLSIDFHSDDTNLTTQKLIIFPKLFSIYNYENFKVRKVKFENSNLIGDVKYLQSLFKKISNKKKIYFENLNIKIKDGQNHVVNLKKVNFFNFGYKKNTIYGEIFNRNFKLKFIDDTIINFKIPDTGIVITLSILESTQARQIGNIKGNILKSNFKFNFFYEKNFLKINNFFFRDRNLSFNSNGSINLKPFFKINLESEIKNIKSGLFSNIDINKLLRYKNLIKKLNSQNILYYKSEKFGKNIIKDLSIKIETAYGRMKISKNFYISNTFIYCTNSINLLEEFPIFYFDCTVNSKDKKKLLKEFGIDYKSKKKETLDINSKGNINIFNNKINFDLIQINKDYKASNEDLKYYKNSFEKILFNENFLNIFRLAKIKNFIIDVS